MAEVMEEQQEITDALSMGMGGEDVMDDMDLLDELGELEEGMLDEELAGMGAVPTSQPVGMAGRAAVAAPVAAGMSAEDQEMARLEAEMLMVPAS